jgi:hypothetical protein
MTKPTERIVVFVTPAQKLAITSSAQRLDISVSELMRRAVSTFGATEAEVKVAGLIDRLKKPSTPDPLSAMLAASQRMIERKGPRTPSRATGGRMAARLANDDALVADVVGKVAADAMRVQAPVSAALVRVPDAQAQTTDGLPHPVDADDAPAIYSKPPHAPSGDDMPSSFTPMLNPSA